jgi:hypothetical protein
LQQAISATARGILGQEESLHLRVKELVDRRGLEPLTSAVQGRRSPS